MWGSLAVSQGETLPDILAHHPHLTSSEADYIIKGTLSMPMEDIVHRTLDFPTTGDGWIETYTGMSATALVKQLKKQRRHQKEVKSDIDNLIGLVRTIKGQEVQATLDGVGWANGRQDTIRSLGLSDRNLKSLRLFHNSRESSLLRACDMWENAEGALKMLDEYDDVWGDEERKAWVNAMDTRRDARKVWKQSLHQMDRLTDEQKTWMTMAKGQLESKGPMDSRALVSNMVLDKDINSHTRRRITTGKMSQLLKMYGEEMNIMKGTRKGEYVLLKNDGLVLKNTDIWGYAAGFLDADGSIYITDRGEPRASFIATGTRGKVHCEELHKILECGVLQTDQKVYKDGQRSQHRISFYAKDDLRKLLDGVLPHLRMKEIQAKAVLRFINENDKARKSELQKVVQFLNWEGTNKGEKSLREWGIDRDTVMSWTEGLQ